MRHPVQLGVGPHVVDRGRRRVGVDPEQRDLRSGPPSRRWAATIAVVVSGQIVVHSESLKARITTWPRKERSDTRAPNWSMRVKSGA